MDEVIEQEYQKTISDPYATPHGYFGDPATQAMLDMLDSRFALVQGNPLAIEIMARRQLEAMDFLNGLDRAAAEANSHSSGGGGGSGGVTSAGDLSSDAGITTGDFDPPGTWSDGGNHGTPDPGLPINPDYVGIQPIILDLDGDGVEVNASARVNFDWDGDGFLESGNWAAADDGFLVIDLEADGSIGTNGGDGVINLGREIAFSQWADTDMTDLQALAEATDADGNLIFDSNGDGVLDANDDVWSSMKVWQDLNQNGEVDEGELQTLDAWGISQISLSYDDGSGFSETEDDVAVLGNVLHGLASFVMNGEVVEGGVGDVSLVYNSQGWRRVETADGYTIEFESGDDLAFRDMANVAAADADLAADGLAGVYGDARDNVLDASGVSAQVVITGGAGNDAITGGSGDDLLSGGAGADVIHAGAGNDVVMADSGDDIAGGDVTGGEGYDKLIVSAETVLDIADFSATGFEALVAGDGDDSVTATDDDTGYALSGNGGNDALTTAGGNDVLSGGAGNDILTSGAGADRLFGGSGNDVLDAGDGNDFLAGGAGDGDTLLGGAGNDIYFYGRGDGHDIIHDVAQGTYFERVETMQEVQYGSGKKATYVNELRTGLVEATGQIDGGIDTLQFGNGIGIEDVLFSRDGDNALIEFRNLDDTATDVDESTTISTDDSITIQDWADQRSRIENFAFASGLIIDMSQVMQGQSGDATANELNGGESGDWLNAGAGDDTLTGGAGRDILIAGAGNDSLDGGDGRDLLLGGDGADMADGGAGDDYILGGAGTDTLNGSAGDDTLMGGAGDDVLVGGAGADMLLGGAGNDTLNGGAGNDTYFFFRGDGHDTIHDETVATEVTEEATGEQVYQRNGKHGRYVEEMRTVQVGEQLQGGWDVLQFGYGVLLEDVFLELQGDDLVMGIRQFDEDGNALALADMEDVVTVQDWTNDLTQVEELRFGDGRAIDISEVESFQSGLGANDTFAGTTGNDVMTGGGGDDTLTGEAGNDVLAGGTGNDVLDGGEGDDDLVGGDGADTLSGGAGKDYLQGGAGNDTIDGGDGDDVISGGRGDDLLRGGKGNDIYIFNRGDGHDIIDESIFTASGTGTGGNAFSGGTSETIVGDDGSFSGTQTGSGKGLHNVWVSDTRTGATITPVEGGDDTLQFGNWIDISDLSVHSTGSGLGDDLVIDLVPLEGDEITDSVTITNFATDEFRIETFRFANGFVLDVSTLGYATTGGADADSIDLTGISLLSGTGAWLAGGAGDDTLTGSTNTDIMIGGADADRLEGGAGNDIYVFGRGDGADTISDSAGGGDALLFGVGITIEDLILERDGGDMHIYVADDRDMTTPLAELTDSITVEGWTGTGNRVELLQFFNGLDFDISGIRNTYLGSDLTGSGSDMPVDDTLNGSNYADWIDGFGGNDVLNGLNGDDFIFGREGDDTIDGGRGNDIIAGGIGNDMVNGGRGDDVLTGGADDDALNGDQGTDVLMGGTGNDTLNGGAGNDLLVGDQGDDIIIASQGADQIRFGYGDGNDTYLGSTVGGINGTDTFVFENGIGAEDIWFDHIGDDLIVRLIGSDDTITFENWYDSGNIAAHVAAFQAGGQTLSYQQVNDLVDAMYDYVGEINDGTTAYGLMPGETPESVATAIDAAWA